MDFLDEIFGNEVVEIHPSPSVNQPHVNPPPKKDPPSKNPPEKVAGNSSKKPSKAPESKKPKITFTSSGTYSIVKGIEINALKSEPSRVILDKITSMMDEMDLASEKTRSAINLSFDRLYNLEKQLPELQVKHSELIAQHNDLLVRAEKMEKEANYRRAEREFLLREAVKKNNVIANLCKENDSLRQIITDHENARKKERSAMAKSLISFCYTQGVKAATRDPSLSEAISSDELLAPTGLARDDITDFIKNSLDQFIVPVESPDPAFFTQEEITNLVKNPWLEVKALRKELKSAPSRQYLESEDKVNKEDGQDANKGAEDEESMREGRNE